MDAVENWSKAREAQEFVRLLSTPDRLFFPKLEGSLALDFHPQVSQPLSLQQPQVVEINGPTPKQPGSATGCEPIRSHLLDLFLVKRGWLLNADRRFFSVPLNSPFHAVCRVDLFLMDPPAMSTPPSFLIQTKQQHPVSPPLGHRRPGPRIYGGCRTRDTKHIG